MPDGDVLALVSSLYASGTIAGWLLAIASVVISWTINKNYGDADTLGADLFAVLTLPLVAAVDSTSKILAYRRPDFWADLDAEAAALHDEAWSKVQDVPITPGSGSQTLVQETLFSYQNAIRLHRAQHGPDALAVVTVCERFCEIAIALILILEFFPRNGHNNRRPKYQFKRHLALGAVWTLCSTVKFVDVAYGFDLRDGGFPQGLFYYFHQGREAPSSSFRLIPVFLCATIIEGIWVANCAGMVVLLSGSFCHRLRQSFPWMPGLLLADRVEFVIRAYHQIFNRNVVPLLGLYLLCARALSNRPYLPQSAVAVGDLDQAVALVTGLALLFLVSARAAWKSRNPPPVVEEIEL
jgi:hypothetical protein